MLNSIFLNNKGKSMDKLITLLMVVSAAITLWAVLTPNHLFIS
jgi:hypothetical protein